MMMQRVVRSCHRQSQRQQQQWCWWRSSSSSSSAGAAAEGSETNNTKEHYEDARKRANRELNESQKTYKSEMASLRASFRQQHAAKQAADEAARRAQAEADLVTIEARRATKAKQTAENIEAHKKRMDEARQRRDIKRDTNHRVAALKKDLDEWYWQARLDSSETRLKALSWCDAPEDVQLWMETKLDKVKTLVSKRPLEEDGRGAK